MMNETLYDSARRRLPELEAEAAKLSERLEAVNAEIGVAKGVLKAAPDADQLSGNSGQLPRAKANRVKDIATLVRLAALSASDAHQSEIIAARVNGESSK